VVDSEVDWFSSVFFDLFTLVSDRSGMPVADGGLTTPNVKNCTFRSVAKTCRHPEAKCNTFLQREILAFSVESRLLQKRSMLLKNSLRQELLH
jgi:hypothetical protein